MSTNTYVALKTTTVSNTTTASVDLDVSGITGYTDLVVVATVGSDTAGGQVIRMRFNGDTSSNYSRTYLSGSGSAPFSGRNTSLGYMPIDAYSNVPNGSGLYEANIIQIMNYNQTNTFKTVLSRSNMASYGVDTSVGSWFKSTKEAITLITLLTNTGYWSVGSTFTVYGIANADVGAYATGGIITQDANYYYHAFGSSSTFTPTRNLTADILVVAGGGGGSSANGGGGGAGGLLGFTSQSLTNGTGYTCTVGAGGAGGANNSNAVPGSQGSDSQFGSLTLVKGGAGAISYGGSDTTQTGGSGAGGTWRNSGSIGTGGSPTSGQGYAGGNGLNASQSSGGGGGAGAVGATASANGGGAGGAGSSAYSSWLATTGLGVNVGGTYYIAGGGGGGGFTTTVLAAGGSGGGGASVAGTSSSTLAVAGTANTGGGGGGGSYSGGSGAGGGSGGSGLIIVRYSK